MSFPEDNDPFENLKSGVVPPPRADARERAMAAARSAFETETRKSAVTTQGTGLGERLISIITSWKRISIMDMRIPVGTAAIALLVLPLGWQLYSSTALTRQGPASRSSWPRRMTPWRVSRKRWFVKRQPQRWRRLIPWRRPLRNR